MTKTSSSRLITDTVVFAHGVGNLIIANAWHNKLCKLASSSYWMEINVRCTPRRMYADLHAGSRGCPLCR